MLRFLHCADLHLDRSFEGLHTISKRVKKMPAINEQMLENIVFIAIDKKVDMVLLAGDTFHQNHPSFKTQHHFVSQMQRLEKNQIPVYVIFGNHDYYEKERYWFDFPKNVHLFTEEKVATFTSQIKSGESVSISGFSYRHPHLNQGKVKEFPNKKSDYHIGLYHGDPTSDYFAPFRMEEMKQKNYDYWALGHIHVPTLLSDEPPIIYSGTPQGHTQKEKETGVNLVELTPTTKKWQKITVSGIQWVEKSVSLSNLRSQKEVLQKVEGLFEKSADQLIKIYFTGVDHLPENWLQEREKIEIIDYLNEFFEKKQWHQMVYDLSIQEASREDKLSLAATEAFKEQILSPYQKKEVFEETVSELYSHPLFPRELEEQLSKQSIEQVRQVLDYKFSWEKANEVD